MPDAPLEPEAILAHVLALDPALCLRAYYGERSAFYDPGGAAPLGVIVASVKDRDGPNDRASALARPGVFRFAFQVSRGAYTELFGAVPARPAKGAAVALPGHDSTRLDVLSPHPVYAWMRWVQVLSPTPQTFAALQPLLAESLEGARERWRRRVDTPAGASRGASAGRRHAPARREDRA